MGTTWEHRPQGGKYFGWNGKVLTARLQIGGRPWQWPLHCIDEEKAEALMAPVRIARERLQQAAAEELNCELGTDAAMAAAEARAGARAQLARAISTAGGLKELVEFVSKGPQKGVGTAVPQPGEMKNLLAARVANARAVLAEKRETKLIDELIVEFSDKGLRPKEIEAPLNEELKGRRRSDWNPERRIGVSAIHKRIKKLKLQKLISPAQKISDV